MKPVMETPDRVDRDRARFRLDANIVVEAGAGTGKTTLLTDRILFLVLGWDKPEPVVIERVAALTFTEKAAGEIKLRLSDRLVELSSRLSGAALTSSALERADRTLAELRDQFGKADEEILARARAAIEDLDKAPIGTIHFFCAQLLRLHPVEAGVDPAFRVDEGEAFSELFDAEWASWLDDELGERPPRRGAWLELLAATDLDSLEALARELCSEKLAGGDGRSVDAQSAAQLRSLAERLAELPANRPKPRGKILEAIAECRARLLSAASAAERVDPPLDADEPKAPREAKWPSAWEEDPSAEELYERATAIAALVSPRSEAVVRRSAALLAPFSERLRKEYARRGWISFDGLLRRARDLMRDQPRVREQVKRRFAALLIDEFQDTDPLQGELLMYLAEKPAGNAGDWRDVVAAPGRVFVVGDPKQSIYRFRGADIAAYEGFVTRLKDTGALTCDLTANFRSVPGVVEPVNHVFAKVMVSRAGAQPPYKAIAPARVANETGPVVSVAAVTGDGEASEVQRAEADWITDWIVANARIPGGPTEGRRHLKDVAILLRSSTPLPALLEAFKSAGVPYAVEVERFFYEAPEVSDFLNVLRAVDDPEDRVALAGLLRSPLAGLTDGGLLELARAGGLDYRRDVRGDALPEGERRRAAALFASLRAVRQRAGRLPLGELVDAALRSTRLIELAARAYHGQQTVSNLLKLRRLAAEASDGRGTTLKEFAARVREAARESKREGESPLADERLEAVRIMTMHKSKGLEFPVVFAMSLSSKPGGNASKPSARLDPDTGRAGLRVGDFASAAVALADVREKSMESHESVRLLYVAMTRARERLILVGREKPASGSLAGHLLRASAWPADGRTGILPVELIAPSGAARQQSATFAANVGGEQDAKAAVAGWKALRVKLDAGALPRMRAATAYLKELPKRPDDSENFAGSPAGAQTGQICHRVLQEWDFRLGGDVADAATRARALLERRAPGPHWARAQSEAASVLSAFFASAAAAELARVEIVGRETPFAFADGPMIVRGAADLIYRENGRLTVVDFKSEPVDESSAAAVRLRYAEQGRAYVAAVENAWGEKANFRILFLRRPDLNA